MILPEKNPAQEIFRQFCRGYKNRDLAALMNLFADNIHLWGSGCDEYRIGLQQVQEQLQRDWVQSEKGEIEVISFVPSPKDALWAAAICKAKITIDNKEHIFSDLRGTIILEKKNGGYKISHMHASFPDMRNPEHGSFPINQ